MKKVLKTIPPDNMPDNYEKNILPGYEFYPETDDIYNKFREDKSIDPEDISRVKKRYKSDHPRAYIEEESNDDEFGRDLDVPGSDLDDDQEDIGNEDEENNYYSIGGDDHNNLDEGNDDI